MCTYNPYQCDWRLHTLPGGYEPPDCWISCIVSWSHHMVHYFLMKCTYNYFWHSHVCAFKSVCHERCHEICKIFLAIFILDVIVVYPSPHCLVALSLPTNVIHRTIFQSSWPVTSWCTWQVKFNLMVCDHLALFPQVFWPWQTFTLTFSARRLQPSGNNALNFVC